MYLKPNSKINFSTHVLNPKIYSVMQVTMIGCTLHIGAIVKKVRIASNIEKVLLLYQIHPSIFLE